MLTVNKLTVFFQKKAIVKTVSFTVKLGEIVLLMGPNGSGKSTLVNALAGHPDYEIKSGLVKLDGVKINDLKPEEKVKQGLFLAWQNPVSLPGVSLTKLLRELGVFDQGDNISLSTLRSFAKRFYLSDSLLLRGLHDGFSGGERKKIEMLQAKLLGKKYLLFDEIDTGLDLDALRQIGKAINELKQANKGCLVVTHYPELFRLLKFDRVLVMKNGQVVKIGKQELAQQIAQNGYGKF